MQGLVTIDFGNTNPHAGLFHKNQNSWQLIKVCPWNELSLYLTQLEMNASNTSMVLSQVKAREDELATLQQQGFHITRVSEYWRGQRFAGMPVNYAKTIGEDRLIQAFYAYKNLKQNILLLDAGTFLTMDVITKDGFMGGYIVPGIDNYNSLFNKGEQLQEVLIDKDLSISLPQTTKDAMRDSYFAFAALAQKLTSDHKIDKILLTGGNCALWKQIFDQLKVSVIVEEDPTLIHLALQYWMTTQIETL